MPDEPVSHGRDTVRAAIEASWAPETAAQAENWRSDNPSGGHCEVASFVAWELLGGDLVLGEVHRVDGSFQEHHYWNRIDGHDLDLTRQQFRAGEIITEKQVLEGEFLRTNQDAMRPEIRARIDRFREVVVGHLGTGDPQRG